MPDGGAKVLNGCGIPGMCGLVQGFGQMLQAGGPGGSGKGGQVVACPSQDQPVLPGQRVLDHRVAIGKVSVQLKQKGRSLDRANDVHSQQVRRGWALVMGWPPGLGASGGSG